VLELEVYPACQLARRIGHGDQDQGQGLAALRGCEGSTQGRLPGQPAQDHGLAGEEQALLGFTLHRPRSIPRSEPGVLVHGQARREVAVHHPHGSVESQPQEGAGTQLPARARCTRLPIRTECWTWRRWTREGGQGRGPVLAQLFQGPRKWTAAHSSLAPRFTTQEQPAPADQGQAARSLDGDVFREPAQSGSRVAAVEGGGGAIDREFGGQVLEPAFRGLPAHLEQSLLCSLLPRDASGAGAPRGQSGRRAIESRGALQEPRGHSQGLLARGRNQRHRRLLAAQALEPRPRPLVIHARLSEPGPGVRGQSGV